MIDIGKLFNAAQMAALYARKELQNRIGIPDTDAPLDQEKAEALFAGLNMMTAVLVAGIIAHCKDEEDINLTIGMLFNQAKSLLAATPKPQAPGRIVPVSTAKKEI